MVELALQPPGYVYGRPELVKTMFQFERTPLAPIVIIPGRIAKLLILARSGKPAEQTHVPKVLKITGKPLPHFPKFVNTENGHTVRMSIKIRDDALDP